MVRLLAYFPLRGKGVVGSGGGAGAGGEREKSGIRGTMGGARAVRGQGKGDRGQGTGDRANEFSLSAKVHMLTLD